MVLFSSLIHQPFLPTKHRRTRGEAAGTHRSIAKILSQKVQDGALVGFSASHTSLGQKCILAKPMLLQKLKLGTLYGVCGIAEMRSKTEGRMTDTYS